MAYRQTDDDDELMQASAAPVTGVPVPTVGGGQAVGSPSTPAAPSAPASRFVGFQQYLSANRSAADATAGKVADRVEGLAQDAQRANQAVRDDVAARPTTPSAISQMRDIPDAPAPAGPSGAESPLFGQAATATHDAQTALANTGTTGGLQQLIGTGSGGAGRFDAGLVGAAGAQRFQGLRSRYADLQGALDRTATYTSPQTTQPSTPITGSAAPVRTVQPDIEEERRRRLQQRNATRRNPVLGGRI